MSINEAVSACKQIPVLASAVQVHKEDWKGHRRSSFRQTVTWITLFLQSNRTHSCTLRAQGGLGREPVPQEKLVDI